MRSVVGAASRPLIDLCCMDLPKLTLLRWSLGPKRLPIEAADVTKGLPAWRKASIESLLLADAGKLDTPVNISHLVDAKRILDDHQDNVYQRLSILKSRLALLSVLGVVFLILWLTVAPPVPLKLLTDDYLAVLSTNSRLFWSMAILAGLLGGLLSAFTSAIGSDIKRSNIPAELATQTITWARLVVSALSPLAIIWFLGSVISFPEFNNSFVMVVAIASGFTDRLLVNAIENFAAPK